MAKWEVSLTGSGLPNVTRALRNSSLPNTHMSNANGRFVYSATDKGFVSAASDGNYWELLPIAVGLPVNNFEVLLETVRFSDSPKSYLNTGGGLFFSDSPAGLYDADSYYVAFGTGGKSARRFRIFRRSTAPVQTQLYRHGVSEIPAYHTGQVVFMRVRRNGSSIQTKIWDSTQPEPDTWQGSVTDATYDVSGVAILTHGNSLVNMYSRVAIATDGDTATFEEPLLTINGLAPTGNSYEVAIRSAVTDAVVGYAYSSDTTGEWSFGLHSDEPVYAVVDAPGGPFYDYVFARGHGILSGTFPLSLLTNGGNLPSQSDIRILYRPESGDFGDGLVVATTTCDVDGTWQVSELNEDLKFDIVARIPGFNDVIISDVQPVSASPSP